MKTSSHTEDILLSRVNSHVPYKVLFIYELLYTMQAAERLLFMCILMWLLRCFSVKVLPHCWQVNGFSPVWIHVSFKGVISCETLSTLRAGEMILSSVNCHVNFKVLFYGEALCTLRAGKVFLSSVKIHVLHKVWFICEPLCTMKAGERFLSCVNSHVTFKVLMLCETHHTVGRWNDSLQCEFSCDFFSPPCREKTRVTICPRCILTRISIFPKISRSWLCLRVQTDRCMTSVPYVFETLLN